MSRTPRTAGPPAAIALTLLLGTVVAAEPVELRGYGTVSADIAPAKAVFACESVEKADILLDKLQADLFWDTTLPVARSEAAVGTAKLAIYALPGYGSALIARVGHRVVVLGGADPAAVSVLAAQEPLLNGADATSHAAKPRPMYLDFYDNRAFKADGHAIQGGGFPFLKTFGGGVVMMGPAIDRANAASGELSMVEEDELVRQAEREGQMVVVGPSCGLGLPLWLRNLHPELAMRPSPTMAMGDWGGAPVAGTAYESWSTPIDLRWQTTLDYTRQMVEHYLRSPNLGGWLPFAGSPGWEYGLHGRSQKGWDHSLYGQQGFRAWLKDVRGLTLAEIGTRWHGDPKRFAAWDDIRVSDVNEFYGRLGDGTLLLRDGWRWRPVDKLPDALVPPQVAGWVPMAMPPSQQMSFINNGYSRTSSVFDVTFDAAAWSRANAGKDVWLVFGEIGVGADAARVWLNGKPLAMPIDAASKDGPFSVPVTGLLRGGSNHLQVGLRQCWANCDARLAGPVFLTTHQPRRLPYLGAQDNARCVDLLDWRSWMLSEYHRQTFAIFRKLDPDRPMILSGGAGGAHGDFGGRICVDFGMGSQHTGRESSYTTEHGSHGIASGFYGTSEWSGYPRRNDASDGDMLERGFSWIMFDADAQHHLISGNWVQEEQKDQWFSRHHRQFQLFGKYLREPEFVVLRSAQSPRYGSAENAGWNLGRGEFQAAHYDNACVNEAALQAGSGDRFPLMFDNGSEFMDDQTVAAVRRYVEQGGIFVALTMTGRHAPTQPDAYQLSELSGFKAVRRDQPGRITFEKTLPLFQGWEGRSFDGWGSAIDWQDADYARTGLTLTPVAGDAVALARWDDGAVAIGSRQVGKGRIIVLGSTFWRAGKDLRGIWRATSPLELEFLDKLFTGCGVQRKAHASVPELWARRMVSKNGLQRWLVACNSRNEALSGDVWMATDGKPEAVSSLDTQEAVPFSYADGGVWIRSQAFTPYEVKVFAVHHADLSAAVSTWWQEKLTYWRRTPAMRAISAMTLPARSAGGDPDTIPLHQWRFAADRDGSISQAKAWMSTAFTDGAWQTMGSVPWGTQDERLRDYHGVGLYRQVFTIPAAWKGRRIVLSLHSYNAALVDEAGSFAINGSEVFLYKARRWSQTYGFDISALVRPGANVLTLQVPAGAKNGGLDGSVWIEGWAPLAPAVDLTGAWQAVGKDWIATAPAQVPGMATGKLLRRDFQVPADWKGKTVFLEWSSKVQWVGSVVINGQPISFNGPGHPFSTWSRVNVGMYLLPGQRNVIEVWPYATMPVGTPEAKNSEFAGLQLDGIRIGVR